jgi:YVTN family beta-propeller protein
MMPLVPGGQISRFIVARPLCPPPFLRFPGVLLAFNSVDTSVPPRSTIELVKRFALVGFAALIGIAAVVSFPRLGRQPDGSFLIPTGQRLTPAGKHIEVNDRPLGMVLSPDGSRLAVVTGSNFAPRALHIIDAASTRVLHSLPVGDSFVGVAFSADGRSLYVGGGASHEVKVFRDGAPQESFAIPGSAPSGLSLHGSTLYVALNLKHAVAAIDLDTRRIVEIPVGMHPYTTAVAAGKVYVSNWAGRRARPGDTTDELYRIVVDPRTGIPSTGTLSVVRGTSVVKDIDVGLHPSALAVSPSGDRVYAANANSDTVSVIDTNSDAVVETISTRPGTKAPIGSSPNALAVSRDGKTLFVANGANNALAVVDVAARPARVRGFVPTGWYPTAIAVPAKGRQIWTASGYGFGSIAPTAPERGGRSYRDRVGIVSLVDVPEGRELARATEQVLANNRLVSSGVRPDPKHPVPMNIGKASPIRHVFYIIKENRTYDQLLGDLPQGNGDPSLVQFGREITPNHHALAEQFVLLDNFYTPADQSALGHRWCTQGYASDWLFKYGNGRNDQNPMLYAPNEFIWDNAKAQGVSVHSFGERGVNVITPKGASFIDILKGRGVSIKPHTYIAGLKDVFDPEYPAYGGVVPDQYRADVFLRRFRQWEKDGNLPRLVIMLLPNDHTNGTSPGLPTPRAAVADNDLALGRIVEAISKSRYWKQSAIFVTEDDAQNGYDHVAGHRTIALVVSPWVRRKAVDSHFYTTINLYRTMEQILGLPPRNQFDVAAEPMFTVFTDRPDDAAYTALPNRVPLDELNPPLKALRGQARADALASMQMDFSEPDAAPEQLLNQVIWRATRKRSGL